MFCLPYSLALPKHSIHLRQGSLWLREMCFVRLLFVLSSIVLHFRSIPCIRSGDLFHSPARPKHSMHPRQGSLSCTAVFRPLCSVLSSIDSLALPKPCSCNAFCGISAVARDVVQRHPRHSMHPRQGSQYRLRLRAAAAAVLYPCNIL